MSFFRSTIFAFLASMISLSVNVGITNANDYLMEKQMSQNQVTRYDTSKNEETTEYKDKAIEEEPEIKQDNNEEIVVQNEEIKQAESKIVNFDEYVAFVDNNEDTEGVTTQSYLDQGYIVRYNYNCFHHNCGKFLEFLNSKSRIMNIKCIR